jgi:hypothetical protein
MVTAVQVTGALTGRTAATVIGPPEPESKFEMFEKSRGAAASSPLSPGVDALAVVGGLSPPTSRRVAPPRRAVRATARQSNLYAPVPAQPRAGWMRERAPPGGGAAVIECLNIFVLPSRLLTIIFATELVEASGFHRHSPTRRREVRT